MELTCSLCLCCKEISNKCKTCNGRGEVPEKFHFSECPNCFGAGYFTTCEKGCNFGPVSVYIHLDSEFHRLDKKK